MSLRRALLPLLVLAALVAAALAVAARSGEEVRSEYGAAFCAQREDVPREAAEECAEEGRELTEPADAALARVAFGSKGVAPTDVLRRGLREARASSARTRAAAPRVAAAQWEFVGPTNIGGRLLDVAIDHERPDTVFVATAGGGVFKTTDNGVTLTPTWPDDLPQAIGALVMTKSGVLFAGTGEAGPGGGSLTYGGDGLYRSADKGRTWQRLPGFPAASSRIGRIVIDPSNEKRMWVAALGNLFKANPERGIYLTEDGGETWQHVLKGDNGTTGAADIAVDPKNPKRLIATTWDHLRKPEVRQYNGVGSGVYRSTDGGRTWARIATGVIGPNPVLGRLGVAIDPQATDTVYVVASGGVGGHAGFYKSTDFGSTFIPTVQAQQAGLSGAFTYGWWFGRVWVDPKDSARVYVAGVDLLRSDDGGLTFNPAGGGMHADHHALEWDPRVKGRMWSGNDGGLYRSDDNGASWKPAKSQPYSQPDALDVSEQDVSRIAVGMQDNGEARNWVSKKGEFTPFGPGGDGQRVLINPKDKNIVYACGQNGACEVSRDGGNTGTSFENTVISARKAFFMPIEFDLETPSTLYTGGEIMNRTDDGGDSWVPISPDLSNGPDTNELNPLYNGRGALSAIGAAPKKFGRLYAGTDDGNLWHAKRATDDGGEVGIGDWVKADDPDLPKAYVTRIEVDQQDPKRAYVTYSGYRGGDNAAYVLRTTDGGVSWTNITGDLPKAPVNDINLVGQYLVVASDFGVYASKTDGGTWYRIGRGLPLTPVYELRTHQPGGMLFAATFGRSVYKIPLSSLDGLQLAEPVVTSTPGKAPKLRALPKARSCRSGATYRLRVRALRATLSRADVRVNGKRVKRLRGKALSRAVTVRLPRRRATVQVLARTTTGTLLKASRTYRACR